MSVAARIRRNSARVIRIGQRADASTKACGQLARPAGDRRASSLT
jgi:hypothetical protein